MTISRGKTQLLRVAWCVALVVVSGAAARLTHARAQDRGLESATPNPSDGLDDGQLHVLPVQGNISLLVNAGGNITVHAGDEGILLVDAGVASMSSKVLEAIRPLSKRPLAYIVNTDDREDHIGGNGNVKKGGSPVPNANAPGQYRVGGAKVANAYIIAHQSILDRMSAGNVSEEMWPTDPYSAAQKSLFFNNEAVLIFHQPSTMYGSSFVFFRRSDVISAGDIFDPTQYPIIDIKNGGSIQGVLQGLNRMKLLMVPADRRNGQQGGTLIIPGHGRLCTYADLTQYLDMVTVMRDRIQYLIKKGMSLEQVKAAKPTQDYDPVYGHATGNWTTDMFVEAVYRSLVSPPDYIKNQQN